MDACRRLLVCAPIIALAAASLSPTPVAAAPGDPTVTNLDSTGDSVCGGSTLTITGTNFNQADAVLFGATSIDSTFFSVNGGGTQIQVSHVPVHDAGTVDVEVKVGSTTSAPNAADLFTYVDQAPTVDSISPDATSASGTPAQATVTGSCFVDQANITDVKFGSTTGTGATVVTSGAQPWPGPTSITVDPPADSPSGIQQSVNVVVDSHGGNTSNSVPYYYASAPSVARVNPSSGSTAGGEAVQITGNDFTGGTGFCDIQHVYFGGTNDAGPPATCSDTSATVAAPPGSAGTVDVVVVTDGGPSSTSSLDHYKYVSGVPTPTVSGVSPNAGTTLGGTKVTITGTGFQGSGGGCNVNEVDFGPVSVMPGPTGWGTGQGCGGGGTSDTSFDVAAPAETCGTVDVVVVTDGGSSATSSADRYTFVNAGVPCVTSVSPERGPVAGGNDVTIGGTSMSGATAVHFGNLTGTIKSVSSSQVVASAPAELAGTVHVTVTNGFGTSVVNPSDQYTYVNRPVVTGLTPSKGKGSGGDSVTVSGSGFFGGGSSCDVQDVMFGASPATGLSNCSDSAITVTSPPDNAGGAVNVTVDTEGGSSVAVPPTADQFTYVAAPAVSGLNPTSGPEGGGNSVTITGTGFFSDKGACDVSSIMFGSNAASPPSACSDTSLTVPAPLATSPGPVDVTVSTNDGGTSQDNSNDLYTYQAAVFYFAEGTTRPGFSETLDLMTPNHDGTATIDYFVNGQTTPVTVGPINLTGGQVHQEDVASDVGSGKDVSARVTFNGPVGVAERVMHFGSGTPWHGSTDIVGTPGPNSDWYFAEGSTLSAFSEYLTLQNPNSSAAHVTLAYQVAGGANPTKYLTVPANTRTTVLVYMGSTASAAPNTDCDPLNTCGVGGGITGVAAHVSSDQPIVAERPMYVDGNSWGSGRIYDGHVAFGANAPASAWYFAEGTTLGGFNEFLTLQNPGGAPAAVTLTYQTDSAGQVVKYINLPASSRTTVLVYRGNTTSAAPGSDCDPLNTCGVGPGVTGVATLVSTASGTPIVAERPMYMYYPFQAGTPTAGATDVLGATSVGQSYGFSALTTAAGQYDYLTVQNPGTNSAHLTLTYYGAPGGSVQKQVTVPAGSRYTVLVFDSGVAGGLGRAAGGSGPLGLVVTSDQPVLIEKPTYGADPAAYGATDTGGYASNF